MPLPGSTRARLGYGALAIVALALLAYAALPSLLARWVEQTLAARGFTQAQVEFSPPGLHGVRIRRFVLSVSAAGQTFDLDARDLDLGYAPATLLAGRVNSLHIAEARLRIASSAQPASDRRAAAWPTPGDWVAAFPLDRLKVDGLHIEQLPQGGAPRTINLRGEVRRTDAQLRSRWTLANLERSLLQFDLDLAANGELAAALYPPGAPERPVVRATQTLSPAAGGSIALGGSLEADLRPLESLLSPWLVLPSALVPLDGHLRAKWRGESSTPGGPAVLSGTLRIEATRLGLGKNLQDGALLLHAEVAQDGEWLRWRIGKDLRLSARLDPALLALTTPPGGGRAAPVPEPLVLTAPRGLSGTFVRSPSGFRLTIAPGTEVVLAQVHTPEFLIPAITATTKGTAQFDHKADTGQWRSKGLAFALTAPVIDTRLAALGRIENLALRARFDAGSVSARTAITLDEATLRLLGGQVRGGGIRLAPGRDSPPFTLHLERIDLARLVALERQQEIEATGRLDGKLPIVLTRRAARIADGWLKATEPGGVVRYRPSPGVASMAQANPNLDLVLKALSNYHYDTLKVGVNYAENGDLALAVAMTGRNPDWNAGQPIHLNLNVEENVPMLLRSLRVADEVGGAVERRMQRDKPKR